MAMDTLSKKRRASVPEQDAAKLKKPKKATTEGAAAPAKKRKATDDAAPVSLKKSKTPKSTGELASKPSKKEPTSETSNKTNGESSDLKIDQSASKKIKGTKAKSSTIAKKDLNLPKPIDEEEDDGQLADEEGETSEVDDQTEALLKGFESDGDEDDKNEGGLEDGEPVPALDLSKKNKKQLKKALATENVKPGTVYIGRIPHGFYEKEMKEYFEQFGKILKIRLSRNPKNGASRHYAFIQFESDAVADVVARTMDGYLMFNHILKVKLIPSEQVRDDLFKGANKRFKKVPWNKIRGRELDLGASEATWDKRKDKEEKRRKIKGEQAKAIGYEFEAPAIKSANGIAKKPEKQLVLGNGEEEPKAIEGASAVEETSKSKKRKAKKTKASENSEVASESVESAPIVAPVGETTTSQPKSKKEKSVKTVESVVPVPITLSDKPKSKTENKTNSEPATAQEPEKILKTKKSKTGLAEEAAAGGDIKKSKKDKKVKLSS